MAIDLDMFVNFAVLGACCERGVTNQPKHVVVSLCLSRWCSLSACSRSISTLKPGIALPRCLQLIASQSSIQLKRLHSAQQPGQCTMLSGSSVSIGHRE